jgi:hypothetical protein
MKRRPLSSAQQTDPSLDDTLNGAGEHCRTHYGDVVGQCSVGPKRRIESDRAGEAENWTKIRYASGRSVHGFSPGPGRSVFEPPSISPLISDAVSG